MAFWRKSGLRSDYSAKSGSPASHTSGLITALLNRLQSQRQQLGFFWFKRMQAKPQSLAKSIESLKLFAFRLGTGVSSGSMFKEQTKP